MPETEQNPTIPRPPRGLEREGRALWRAMHREFSFDQEPGTLAILEQACRTRDEIDRLETAMEGQPYTVLGAAKQPVVNPLVSEARFQRALLAQLISRLGLPDNTPDDQIDELAERRSAAGRMGAKARWKRGY